MQLRAAGVPVAMLSSTLDHEANGATLRALRALARSTAADAAGSVFSLARATLLFRQEGPLHRLPVCSQRTLLATMVRVRRTTLLAALAARRHAPRCATRASHFFALVGAFVRAAARHCARRAAHCWHAQESEPKMARVIKVLGRTGSRGGVTQVR